MGFATILAPAEPDAAAADRWQQNIPRSHASAPKPQHQRRSFAGADVGCLLEDEPPTRPLAQALPAQVARLQHERQRTGEPRVGFHHVAPPLHAANVNEPPRRVSEILTEVKP